MNRIDAIVVLVTQGKGESVDYVRVMLFKDLLEAEEYCYLMADSEPTKYWTHAEIIDQDTMYNVYRYENFKE